MDTNTFNVKATFAKMVSQATAEIQSEVNAALGTNYKIQFLANRRPVTYPSVTLHWLSSGGVTNRRFVTMAQVDVWIQATSPNNPDDRLPTIIFNNLLLKLGFNTIRTSFEHWIQPKDYFNSLTAPADTGRKFKLEIASREGFRQRPDPDPSVWHYSCDFRLEHH